MSRQLGGQKVRTEQQLAQRCTQCMLADHLSCCFGKGPWNHRMHESREPGDCSYRRTGTRDDEFQASKKATRLPQIRRSSEVFLAAVCAFCQTPLPSEEAALHLQIYRVSGPQQSLGMKGRIPNPKNTAMEVLGRDEANSWRKSSATSAARATSQRLRHSKGWCSRSEAISLLAGLTAIKILPLNVKRGFNNTEVRGARPVAAVACRY